MNGKRPDLDSRDHDPEQYDDEYRAMEASLTEYLDERVKLLSAEGQAPPAGGRGEGWFRRWRADVYFVITLVLLGLLWWQQGLPTRGQDPAAGDEAAAAAPGSETTAAAAEAEGSAPGAAGAVTSEAAGPPAAGSAEPPIDLANPGDSWREFVEENRLQVASWLRAVAEARGLAPDQVSPRQKGNFGGWAGTVEAGQPVGVLMGSLRIGLFEYIYGLWSRGRETPTGKWDRVDLVFGATEYDPQLLNDLLAQLGLKRWFERPDPEDGALQAAVIVAWLKTHQP